MVPICWKRHLTMTQHLDKLSYRNCSFYMEVYVVMTSDIFQIVGVSFWYTFFSFDSILAGELNEPSAFCWYQLVQSIDFSN